MMTQARKFLPASIPFLALIYYALVRIYYYDLPLFHGADSYDPRVMGGVPSLFQLNLTNTYLITVLIQVFVASFMWIPIGVILLAIVNILFKHFKNPGNPKVDLPHRCRRWLVNHPTAWQLVPLYLIAFYALTRVVPVANPRYLMPLIPLTLLLMVCSIKSLGWPKFATSFFLTLFTMTLIISQKRTIDPISRSLLGTFPFGKHELLNMTSISKTCCGYGRDQLVYNLEFIEMMRLQNKIFANLKPTPTTTVAYHSLAFFFITGHLDPTSFALKMSPTTLQPRFIDHESLLTNEDIEEFYYIDMPNIDSQEALNVIQEKYRMEESLEAEEGGYKVRYYRFTRLRAHDRI